LIEDLGLPTLLILPPRIGTMVKKKEQVDTIHQAKIEVREKVGKIFHDAKQSHRQYSYTSHTAVTAAVVPAMHEVGMTYNFMCSDLRTEGGFAIMMMKVCFNYGEEADFCTVYCGDKLRDGTSMGSITSYGLKVALLKYFGLESGEKDLEAIQAEHEAIQANAMREKALSTEQEEAAKKTAEIFNGKEISPTENTSHREQMKDLAKKDFLMLCGELNVSNEQIQRRIEKEGYSNLGEVSEDILEQWNETMTDKISELECIKDA